MDMDPDFSMDWVSLAPWEFINGVFEITCYLWSGNRQKLSMLNLPSLYGSQAEGTATGLINRKYDPVFIEDHDGMIVAQLEGSPSFHIKTDECHAGYVNVLCKLLRLKNGKEIEMSSFVQSMAELHDARKYYKKIGPFEVSSKMTGPAYKMMHSSWYDKASEMDVIYALPGPSPWPIGAEEWRSRSRQSGWPSASQAEEVISQGYLLVPVAHPTSKHPESEWRISFSQAEKTLIRGLDRWQRNCYMIVKLLCKNAFSGWKLLSSYHIKTIFLWMLEEYPAEMWGKNNMGHMSFLLLERTTLAFAKRNLPSYFMPSNNLIDHLSREHTSVCVRILRDIRINHMSHFTSLTNCVIPVVPQERLNIYKQWNAKFNRESEPIKSALIYWCLVIARGQSKLASHGSYKPFIEIVLKLIGLCVGTKAMKGMGLLVLPDIYIEEKAYQKGLMPDAESVLCAFGSHFRVLYHNTTDEDSKASLFKQTRALFESAVETTEGEHPLWDYTIAEYAGFLYDAGRHEDASNLVKRKYIETDGYNHFVQGYGYLEIKSKYFILWVKFHLALSRGEAVNSIVKEYEDSHRLEDSHLPPFYFQLQELVLTTMPIFALSEKKPVTRKELRDVLLQLMKDKIRGEGKHPDTGPSD